MENKNKTMGSDIIAEIKRGRKIGYSDKIIKKSLELEGYSSGSIKEAFKEVERNGNGNGVSVIVKTRSIKRAEPEPLTRKTAGKAAGKKIQEPAKPESPLISKEKGPEAEKYADASEHSKSPGKHWIKIAAEIILSIILFGIIGILIYLFMIPAILSA